MTALGRSLKADGAKQQILRVVLQIIGAAMMANGIWMVSRAIQWFFHIPVDMPATGEPNGHWSATNFALVD